MARVSPAPPEKFAEVSDYMERWKRLKGYPPNSWLNRWCTTFATEIEPRALAFGEKHLAGSGWNPGVRQPAQSPPPGAEGRRPKGESS